MIPKEEELESFQYTDEAVTRGLEYAKGFYEMYEYPCYRDVLELAGAEVLVYGRFGDWQGSWFAKVRYDGKLLWIEGDCGSCSGCDALESYLDYEDNPDEWERYGVKTSSWGWSDAVERDFEGEDLDHVSTRRIQEKYLSKFFRYLYKLSRFGRSYLDNPSEWQKLVDTYTEQSEWGFRRRRNSDVLE